MPSWPKTKIYKSRYFVPDLSPEQRAQLRDFQPKMVFVAESPHEAEVAPEAERERRPLCGKAGREWWGMIGQILEHKNSQATDLERLLHLCCLGELAVMNAVQFPLDPKITAHYGEEASPLEALSFTKVAPYGFKKLRATDAVKTAVHLLRERLVHPSVRGLPVISLGNDAQWFVEQALESSVGEGRNLMIIPHPSAWWRRGGFFREKARGQLEILLNTKKRADLLQSQNAG